jgi:hypothetical protein
LSQLFLWALRGEADNPEGIVRAEQLPPRRIEGIGQMRGRSDSAFTASALIMRELAWKLLERRVISLEDYAALRDRCQALNQHETDPVRRVAIAQWIDFLLRVEDQRGEGPGGPPPGRPQ